MSRVLIVFCCGGAGCVARYLVALAVGPRAFPLATLIVNLVGSFLIALILQLGLQLGLSRSGLSDHLKLALTTGFMGGFTTYSSFNFETTKLILDGAPGRGLANAAATLIGAFAAGLLGLWLARRIAA